MKKILLLSLCSLMAHWGFAQQIDACDDPGTIVLSSFCGDACVLCDMDGYVGNNSATTLGEAPPGFCASQLHNTQWVGFVAGSEDLTIEITPSNCMVDFDGDGMGEGLQIGIYNTTDCDNFDLVSNCDGQVEEGEVGVFSNTEPLIPGGIYFLVIDGAFGDICDFTVDVTEGSTQAPTVDQVIPTITSPASGCPGEIVEVIVDPIDGAGAYYWTIDGVEVGTDEISDITLPLVDGTYTLCVDPYNPCSQGLQGCTTIDVVTPGTNVFDVATICDGDVYTIYEMDFTTAGQYNFTYENPGECPDVVQLDLIVDPIDETFLVEEICPDFSFEVGNSIYTDSGVYMDVVTGDNGCDSIVHLDLTVVGTDFITSVIGEICEGETFQVAGQNLTVGGNYAYVLTDQYDCDSLIDVNLTVFSVENDFLEVDICDGEFYNFGGNDLYFPGEYIATFLNANNCEYTTTLQLNVHPHANTEIDADICNGQTYFVGPYQYSTTGIFETILQTSYGCDSIVLLNLQVVDNLIQEESLTICAGESIFVNGVEETTSGTYITLHTTTQGCDSTYILNLTVLPEITGSISPVICQGQSFDIGNESFSTSGDYQIVLQSANLCDSTVSVQLTVEPVIMGYEAITVCDGESITVDGTDYTSTGLYDFPYTTTDGCDSIHQIDLTVSPPITFTLDQEICVGTSFDIGGQTLDTAGIYQVVLTSSNNCDSTVTVNLTVTDGLVFAYTEAICDGDTAYITNTPYTTTGNYEELLQTPEGCDSLVQLALQVIPVATASISDSICSGETYSLVGQQFTTDGQHQVTTTSAAGCDSIITLDLTVFSTPSVSIDPEICQGQTFDIGGQSFSSTGAYPVTLTTVNGCDSLVTVNLTVNTIIIETASLTICEGDSVVVGSSVYNTSGAYEDDFVTADGCDSLYQLDLTVIPTVYETINPIICNGETFEIGASSFSVSGTYEETIAAVSGCDSVVTINLLVAPTPQTDISAAICEDASYMVGDSIFTTGGIHTVVLSTNHGCDSTVVLDLEIINFYQTSLDIILCEGESYAVGDSTYTSTGFYQNTFSAQDGCDSIVSLDLLVNPLLFETVDMEICDGESFSIAGVSYNTTGVFMETIPSAITNCDSTVTLNLTVHPVYDLSETATICDGESVAIGDSTYTMTGIFITPLSSINGCDSVVTLDLNVIPIPETFLTESICQDDVYEVGSSSYTDTGIYTDVLTSVVSGCDSIVHLDLTVHAIAETMLVESICDGESFEVGTDSYSVAGNHTTMLTSLVTGCDSIVYLDLTVNSVYEIDIAATICSDETYEVGAESFNTAGIHEVLLMSAAGCDSTVTLNLQVIPCSLAFNADNTATDCNAGSDGSIDFSMTIGTAPYTYTWAGQNTGLSGSGTINQNNIIETLSGLAADSYTIMVIDANLVEVEIYQTITEPQSVTVNISNIPYGLYDVTCEGAADGNLSAEAMGGTAPYTYTWSNGSSGATIDGLPAGNYNLTVTDANGCQQTGTMALQAPPTVFAELEATHPLCFDDINGQIMVMNTDGGTAPYLYAIDGGAFVANPLFAGLTVGMHTVDVQDVNGCEWQQEMEIISPPELFVDLGEDFRMDFGETVQLQALSNGNIVNYEWSGDSSLDCVALDTLNCFNPNISPLETTVYSVKVINDKGCTAEDEITVIVEKPRNIYIPSGFSPNDDGYNDLFGIHAGVGVTKIKSFLIFNRWGESIFEAYDFDPNDISKTWDGKQNGEIINAAVFVYFAEVEFLDGEVILYKGDVMLVP